MWTEPILHVDMDSFFVEVERLSDPSLRGIPVAVGGAGGRGVIASASYEARAFGVRSAQPTAQALRACPHLRVVSPTHGRYSDVSAGVFAVFRSFTPLVEGLSVDEAFLDVSGLRRHYATPQEVGGAIRVAVREETGLPASVGVAASKFVAKLASEAAKPDGLRHVAVGDQIEFVHSLNVSALPGVGPATQAGLERLGVKTVSELAEVPEPALAGSVGRSMAIHLHNLASGLDTRRVEPDSAAKSVSVEETYASDLEGVDLVQSALLAHAHRLSGRLRRAGIKGHTVTLKVRYADFETITRSRTVNRAVDGGRELFKIGAEILTDVDLSQPIRLLGLGTSGLAPADTPSQLDLTRSGEWDSVEDAIFEVRERYGETAIRPARLSEEP